jgi:hypothetical protein
LSRYSIGIAISFHETAVPVTRGGRLCLRSEALGGQSSTHPFNAGGVGLTARLGGRLSVGARTIGGQSLKEDVERLATDPPRTRQTNSLESEALAAREGDAFHNPSGRAARVAAKLMSDLSEGQKPFGIGLRLCDEHERCSSMTGMRVIDEHHEHWQVTLEGTFEDTFRKKVNSSTPAGEA